MQLKLTNDAMNITDTANFLVEGINWKTYELGAVIKLRNAKGVTGTFFRVMLCYKGVQEDQVWRYITLALFNVLNF